MLQLRLLQLLDGFLAKSCMPSKSSCKEKQLLVLFAHVDNYSMITCLKRLLNRETVSNRGVFFFFPHPNHIFFLMHLGSACSIENFVAEHSGKVENCSRYRVWGMQLFFTYWIFSRPRHTCPSRAVGLSCLDLQQGISLPLGCPRRTS